MTVMKSVQAQNDQKNFLGLPVIRYMLNSDAAPNTFISLFGNNHSISILYSIMSVGSYLMIRVFCQLNDSDHTPFFGPEYFYQVPKQENQI